MKSDATYINKWDQYITIYLDELSNLDQLSLTFIISDAPYDLSLIQWP